MNASLPVSTWEFALRVRNDLTVSDCQGAVPGNHYGRLSLESVSKEKAQLYRLVEVSCNSLLLCG